MRCWCGQTSAVPTLGLESLLYLHSGSKAWAGKVLIITKKSTN